MNLLGGLIMDINYELYKVFYYVASTLSFSEASKQLFISQSAVSQSIKTLERKLDQVLFIRSTKKVQLTPEGEILLRHVEPAMNLIKRGEAQLLDSASTGGQIRIGASDTICRYFLVPFIERFHKAFPGAHIKVTNATSIQSVELLNSGQVDFIVVNSPNAYLGSVTKIKRIKIFQDVFLANQSFKELKGRQLSFQELLEYPILMLDKKSTTSEFLHNLFQQNGFASLHAPMARHLTVEPEDDFCTQALKDVLFGQALGGTEAFSYVCPGHKLNHKGKGKGVLRGGNLSVFYGLRGIRTTFPPKAPFSSSKMWENAPHAVERMMYNLKLGGVLDKLSGSSSDNSPNTRRTSPWEKTYMVHWPIW